MRGRKKSKDEMKQYLIEMIQQGRYVKVTAIDPDTGIEVVMVGDASQPQQLLKKLAVQKLEFVLKRPK
jgi:hypothetical protein